MSEWIWPTETSEEGNKQTSSSAAGLGETLKNTLYLEQSNWFLWMPIALALGCAGYFSLLVEPSWALVILLVSLASIFSILVRKHTLALVFSILTLSAAGFTLAKWSTGSVAAPVIQKRIGPVMMNARIETLFYHANGEIKMIVIPIEIDRLKPKDLPHKLRLKLRKSQAHLELYPGQLITARAIIFPPPEPTHPGGFDFARKS